MAEKTVQYLPVVGHPGYRVGDDGTLWSCWRNGGNDKTPRLTDEWRRIKGWVERRRGKNYGYVRVGLKLNGRTVCRRLHSLVLEAFVGPCPDGMQARHLNDDKTCNALHNLAYGTPNQNGLDRYDNNRMPTGEFHHLAKLTAANVQEIAGMLSQGIAQRTIAGQYGVSKSTIQAIASGRTWQRGSTPKAET